MHGAPSWNAFSGLFAGISQPPQDDILHGELCPIPDIYPEASLAFSRFHGKPNLNGTLCRPKSPAQLIGVRRAQLQ